MLGIGAAELVLVLVVLLPTALALLELSRGDLSGNKKLLWAAVVLLVPVWGPIAYFFLGRPKPSPPAG